MARQGTVSPKNGETAAKKKPLATSDKGLNAVTMVSSHPLSHEGSNRSDTEAGHLAFSVLQRDGVPRLQLRDSAGLDRTSPIRRAPHLAEPMARRRTSPRRPLCCKHYEAILVFLGGFVKPTPGTTAQNTPWHVALPFAFVQGRYPVLDAHNDSMTPQTARSHQGLLLPYWAR